jgi:hypothetical protein
MQGYKVKEKTAIVPPVSKLSGHPVSTDGGHLGWRSGSLDIILKIDHLRTIHAMFALNWLTGCRGIFFLNIFPIGSYVESWWPS